MNKTALLYRSFRVVSSVSGSQKCIIGASGWSVPFPFHNKTFTQRKPSIPFSFEFQICWYHPVNKELSFHVIIGHERKMAAGRFHGSWPPADTKFLDLLPAAISIRGWIQDSLRLRAKTIFGGGSIFRRPHEIANKLHADPPYPVFT